MRDRRYRMELRMVRVPVIWKAKVPDRKMIAKRRAPEERKRIRGERYIICAMFDELFHRPMEQIDKLIEAAMTQVQEKPKKPEGKIITFRRYTTLPPVDDE